MAKQLVEIEVTIQNGGQIKIDAKGFTGDACLKETSSLEEALGKVDASRTMKPEAHKKTVISTDKTRVGG